MLKGIKKCSILASIVWPFWLQLEAILGLSWVILACKIAEEPPQRPPKTRWGARIRPDLQNGSKMKPTNFQNDSPYSPFTIDVAVDFWTVYGFSRGYFASFFLRCLAWLIVDMNAWHELLLKQVLDLA